MKNKLMVIKIGGNIINKSDEFYSFLTNFAAIKTAKILIHGGGREASHFSKKLGIQPLMIDGRRVTTLDDLEVVTMVYAGLINKRAVAYLQSKKCSAIGLSGADANCIQSVKRPVKPIDFGYVGDIKKVNSKAIYNFIQSGLSPIFCAITHNKEGQLLNTNADTVAAEVAIAMSTYFDTQLVYCFEKKGVLINVDDENSVVPQLDQKAYEKMKKNNLIHTGMLPKMTNCFYALENGVQKVVIGNASLIKDRQQIHTEIIF